MSRDMAIFQIMAEPKVKATYSLDVATVRVLERVAKRWGVSKSEALRRAIHASAALPIDADPRIDALSELQMAAGLSTSDADAWATSVRDERRAAREPATRRK
jgi:hypothetical protein